VCRFMAIPWECTKTSSQTHNLTLPFSPGNFWPKTTGLILRLLFSVSLIEAESQVVLNTITEHYFQHAFKIWKKRWERCICAEGDYFESDGGQ
jgi:hypothetical protein